MQSSYIYWKFHLLIHTIKLIQHGYIRIWTLHIAGYQANCKKIYQLDHRYICMCVCVSVCFCLRLRISYYFILFYNRVNRFKSFTTYVSVSRSHFYLLTWISHILFPPPLPPFFLNYKKIFQQIYSIYYQYNAYSFGS